MSSSDTTLTDSGFIGDDAVAFDSSLRIASELHSSERGWCRVYKASRYGRWVTVKALRPELTSSPLHRSLLRKEFEIGFGLSHHNIAATISFETVPGLGDAIISEYVDGQTLKEYIASAGRPPRAEAIRILSEICDAVASIHSLGLVHRDLKPSNIMLTRRGHHVRLIDFGAADGDVWCAMKASAGTPAYAAPEQFADSVDADPRIDIYAVGRIISELLPDDRHARAVAGVCTASDPALRPADVTDIPAMVSRRRRNFRLTAGLAVLLTAIVAITTANIHLPGSRPSKTQSPTPIATAVAGAIAGLFSNTTQPDNADVETDRNSAAPISKDNIENVETTTLPSGQPRIHVAPAPAGSAMFPRPDSRSDEADRLLSLLHDKTIEIAGHHLSAHIAVCDTARLQETYVSARQRRWRYDAQMETMRWFDSIYRLNTDILPHKSELGIIIGRHIEDFEVSQTSRITDAEERARIRVGSPRPFRALPVPFNGVERATLNPDGSWSLHQFDPATAAARAAK